MKTHDALSVTVEEYLETIYNMNMEGEVVIGARLAQKFNVSPPSVTETLKRLVRDGYVQMDQKRTVSLTEMGNLAAEAVLRRHRLTERFLVDMLNMPWYQVHEEAGRLEHFISGAVEERVMASLHHPTTCPHGNPIPGAVDARNYLKNHNAIRLSTVPVGATVKLLCISEVVEDEEALIRYFEEKGIMPGMNLTVLSHDLVDEIAGSAQGEIVHLSVDDHDVLISPAAASKLWVIR